MEFGISQKEVHSIYVSMYIESPKDFDITGFLYPLLKSLRRRCLLLRYGFKVKQQGKLIQLNIARLWSNKR